MIVELKKVKIKSINKTIIHRVYDNINNILYKNPLYKEQDLLTAYNIAKDIIIKILNNQKLEHNLFKRGNHKLEPNVLIWDLPVGITCKGICKNCYALKAERIYKNTRIMRLYHLFLIEYASYSNMFKKKLLTYMHNELEKHFINCKNKKMLSICRIHSAGDIYSKSYKDFLFELVKNNTNINFYTYTKVLSYNEIRLINSKYNNFNIVSSLIAGRFINYGDTEYIKKIVEYCKKNNIPLFVCDYGNTNANTCMGTCKACLYHTNVCFKIH